MIIKTYNECSQSLCVDRRNFIKIGGSGLLIPAAGCVDTEDQSYQDGNNNQQQSGLEIVEHDLIIDRGEFVDQVYVEGLVENNSSARKEYVEVNVRVYDQNGNQLDNYFSNTTDLDAGRSWSFEVQILEDAEDVSNYDISVTDSAI